MQRIQMRGGERLSKTKTHKCKAGRKQTDVLLVIALIVVMYGFVDALFIGICAGYESLVPTWFECSLLTAFGMVLGMLTWAVLTMARRAKRKGGPGSQSQVVMGRIGVVAFGGIPAVFAFIALLANDKYSLGYWSGFGMLLSLVVGFLCAIVIIPKE